jgi:hypothetical protein
MTTKAQQIKQAHDQGREKWLQVCSGKIWEDEAICPYSPKTDRLLYAAWRTGFELDQDLYSHIDIVNVTDLIGLISELCSQKAGTLWNDKTSYDLWRTLSRKCDKLILEIAPNTPRRQRAAFSYRDLHNSIRFFSTLLAAGRWARNAEELKP